MNMKTFRASTMREAMNMVKAELGTEAVIMSTREVGRDAVEIVAATDPAPKASLLNLTKLSRRSATSPVAPEVLNSMLTELKDMRHELSRLRAEKAVARRSRQDWDRMIDELRDLARVMGVQGGDDVHAQPIVDRLVRGGVELGLARTLVEQASVHSSNADETLWSIRQSMEDALRPAPAIWDNDSRTVAALVGPTGVGKTTTMAKVAAQAALYHGKKVALVAADTYRIAGVEQVKTYAELLGLPWAVAEDRGALAGALNRFKDADLVLVDTSGHSPWQDAGLAYLDSLTTGLPIERHLCVMANTQGADLSRMVERYRGGGLKSLVVTKTDEARRLGSVLSSVWGTELQIAHVTTGQNVPEDISALNAQKFTQAVLG
jgi:flagellar biosynthesis protein FlhF